MQLGRKANGAHMRTGEGVHLARLNKAPMKIELVPVP